MRAAPALALTFNFSTRFMTPCASSTRSGSRKTVSPLSASRTNRAWRNSSPFFNRTNTSRSPDLQMERFSDAFANTTSVSIPLHPIIAVNLQRAPSANSRTPHSKYCSGSRRLGRWFRLERRLRHFGQRRLQRQHRPGTGDIL